MAHTDENELYVLNWNNFSTNLKDEVSNIEKDSGLSDVTFLCQDKTFHAHRLVLHAGSEYFRDVFKNHPVKNPIFIMYHVKSTVLKKILEFMYCGEVQVEKRVLTDFILLAEELGVRGIATNETTKCISKQDTPTSNELPRKKRKISESNSFEKEEETIAEQVDLSTDEENTKEDDLERTENIDVIQEEEQTDDVEGNSCSATEEKDEKYPTIEPANVMNKSFTRYKRLMTKVEKYADNITHELVKGTRRRCGQCSIQKIEKRTCYYCRSCDVGLCFDCFTPFHQSFDKPK